MVQVLAKMFHNSVLRLKSHSALSCCTFSWCVGSYWTVQVDCIVSVSVEGGEQDTLLWRLNPSLPPSSLSFHSLCLPKQLLSRNVLQSILLWRLRAEQVTQALHTIPVSPSLPYSLTKEPPNGGHLSTKDTWLCPIQLMC